MSAEDRDPLEALREEVRALDARIEGLSHSCAPNRLAIGLLSGQLDRILAAFIIALGAVAYDLEVDMFFSFWAVAALRDPKKKARKSFLGKMFGWMLPTGSRKLRLSSLNMGGIGPKLIRSLMRKKGVPSLEKMIEEAGQLGVRIHVCEMSMGLMGFQAEEMIDYPHLDYVGVGTFIHLAQESRQAFFL